MKHSKSGKRSEMRAKERYLRCAFCGQYTKTLNKMDDGEEIFYTCQNVTDCQARQRQAARVGLPCCGHADCYSPAKLTCSCGVNLCEVHGQMRTHGEHSIIKFFAQTIMPSVK